MHLSHTRLVSCVIVVSPSVTWNYLQSVNIYKIIKHYLTYEPPTIVLFKKEREDTYEVIFI